jgi:hypothetical protein
MVGLNIKKQPLWSLPYSSKAMTHKYRECDKRECYGLGDLNVTNKQTRTNKQPSLTDRFELIITCNVIMPMNQSH